MSDYSVIAELGDSLASVLFSDMNSDPQISGLIDSPDRISLESPADLENDSSVRVSLYLYRILENPYTKNRFPLEGTGAQQRKPPLTLDLYYLLTPMIGTPREQQIVLGKAMQVLYDRTILSGADLSGSLSEQDEAIRMILNPVPLEELTRVWQALEYPYRLSVCYVARVAIVDSGQQQLAPPVVEKQLSYQRLQKKR
ncbi:MAG: DUF4255 domain-containing protein [Acidobacteriaceae bacterium]|nr:DUF4255 domain-containing protein [Acidobacteriaceae bacterium]